MTGTSWRLAWTIRSSRTQSETHCKILMRHREVEVSGSGENNLKILIKYCK